MPLNTPQLYIVGFVVEADKYYWPVHNTFCSFILPDVIFPIVLMIHVRTHMSFRTKPFEQPTYSISNHFHIDIDDW